jgi:hypothetical protein
MGKLRGSQPVPVAQELILPELAYMEGADKALEEPLAYFYTLLGRRLKSQWEFPPPYQALAEGDRIDLELIEGPVSLFTEAQAEAKINPIRGFGFQFASLRGGGYYLLWPGLFDFLISADGHRIYCRLQKRSYWEPFHSYLLGQVLSFALLKQGIESLHCTALVLEQGAVGFIGYCGQGKSSLAAAFLQMGYPLVTDDLLVLKEENHRFLAYPSFPRIKLFPRIARTFLGERIIAAPMNPFTNKLIIPLGPDLSCTHPVPLKAIFVLRRRSPKSKVKRVSIRTLSKHRAFLDLITHSFNTVIKDPERIKRQFTQNARLTAAIPIKSLSYARGLSRLPEVVEAVVANLRHQENAR